MKEQMWKDELGEGKGLRLHIPRQKRWKCQQKQMPTMSSKAELMARPPLQMKQTALCVRY